MSLRTHCLARAVMNIFLRVSIIEVLCFKDNKYQQKLLCFVFCKSIEYNGRHVLTSDLLLIFPCFTKVPMNRVF